MQVAQTFERRGDRLERTTPKQASPASRAFFFFRWLDGNGGQKIEVPSQDVVTTGTPLEPGRAGREVFHEYREAFRRLADS